LNNDFVEVEWNGDYYEYDYHYPVHTHSFFTLSGRYETKSLFNIGPVHSSLGAELMFGLGNTRAYWLINEEKLSNLGMIAGLSPELKFSYPTGMINPFISISFLTAAIYSDTGRIDETEYARQFDYEEFGEYFYGGGLRLGMDIDLGDLVIMPNYRVAWLGGSSDWYLIYEEDGTHTIESVGLTVFF
jgi:hypothetical protein